jgi:hypothetical protein
MPSRLSTTRSLAVLREGGGDDEDQRECVDQKSDRLRREAVETARPADVKKKASLVQ